MNYLIVTTKSWNVDNFNKLKNSDSENNWFLITDKNDLTYDNVKKINPEYIFFPHWSWIIPKEIFENFECVVFHMTDLPYGRGGSPLQNLIIRNHKSTKISAIKVVEELDAGDIYMKEDLNLSGKASDIFKRASDIVFGSMIKKIIKNDIKPKPQEGEVVKFERRKPTDGDITKLDELEKVYDFIRMLDGEGYPKAFLETDNLKFEFEDAQIEGGELIAKVKIFLKNNK